VSRRTADEIAHGYTCDACEQWNGFDEQGDYNDNKPVKQQVLSTFTVPSRRTRASLLHAAGMEENDSSIPTAVLLCPTCQHAQETLVRELASFDDDGEGEADEDASNGQHPNALRREAETAAALCAECNQAVRAHLHAQDEHLALLHQRTPQRINVAAAATSFNTTASRSVWSSGVPRFTFGRLLLRLSMLLLAMLLSAAHVPHDWFLSPSPLADALLAVVETARTERGLVMLLLLALEVMCLARVAFARTSALVLSQLQQTQRSWWARWSTLWGASSLAGAALAIAHIKMLQSSEEVQLLCALLSVLTTVIRFVLLWKQRSGRTSVASSSTSSPTISPDSILEEASAASSSSPSAIAWPSSWQISDMAAEAGMLKPAAAAGDEGPVKLTSPRQQPHQESPPAPVESAGAAWAGDGLLTPSRRNGVSKSPRRSARSASSPAGPRRRLSQSRARDRVPPLPPVVTETEMEISSLPPRSESGVAQQRVPSQSLLHRLVHPQLSQQQHQQRRLSPFAALLADELDDDASVAGGGCTMDEPPLEFSPSLVSLDGPPKAQPSRASGARAARELAQSVWPLHHRVSHSGAPLSRLQQHDEEFKQAAPGLEEDADDASVIDHAFVQRLVQHPTPPRQPTTTLLQPGSLFPTPPRSSPFFTEKRNSEITAGFNEEGGFGLAPMSDSPAFGATHTSTLLSRIDLAADGSSAAVPQSVPVRESPWLAPTFGVSTAPAPTTTTTTASPPPAADLSPSRQRPQPSSPFQAADKAKRAHVHTKKTKSALSLLTRTEAVAAIACTVCSYIAKEWASASGWKFVLQTVYCMVLVDVSLLLLARACGSRMLSASSSARRVSSTGLAAVRPSPLVYCSAALVGIVAVLAVMDLFALTAHQQHGQPMGSVVWNLLQVALAFLHQLPGLVFSHSLVALSWVRGHVEAVLLLVALAVFVRVSTAPAAAPSSVDLGD
jgi:hypothetical protein